MCDTIPETSNPSPKSSLDWVEFSHGKQVGVATSSGARSDAPAQWPKWSCQRRPPLGRRATLEGQAGAAFSLCQRYWFTIVFLFTDIFLYLFNAHLNQNISPIPYVSPIPYEWKATNLEPNETLRPTLRCCRFHGSLGIHRRFVPLGLGTHAAHGFLFRGPPNPVVHHNIPKMLHFCDIDPRKLLI